MCNPHIQRVPKHFSYLQMIRQLSVRRETGGAVSPLAGDQIIRPLDGRKAELAAARRRLGGRLGDRLDRRRRFDDRFLVRRRERVEQERPQVVL
jgi:hypothetical protein